MKNVKTIHVFDIINTVIIGLLLALPYYLFGNRLFLGGDDTRLLYAYPNNVLSSLAIFSWNTISSLPSYLPNHQFFPFLAIESVLLFLVKSRLVVFNFSFSLPFILGFIYFRKLILKLLPQEYLIGIISALIYILSPVTIVSQMFNFLSPMWLVALMPILAYYYISYIENGNKINLVIAIVWSIIFSFAYYAIPWLLSFILPILVGIVVVFFVFKIRLYGVIKKTIVYILGICCSQLFWLIPFISSLTFKGGNDLGAKLASSGLSDSFSPTVIATATGNIIYPLLTLYHRSIAYNYDWKLIGTFLSYYDKTLLFGLIYVGIIYLGITNAQKSLRKKEREIFYFYFVSFLISLFFFTVNIGPLKFLFLLFRYIPGFTIFRNFTDKFSLGYIFIYSGFLAVCLYVIKKSYKSYYLIVFCLLAAILINFAPVKSIVVTPFWKTNSIYTVVNLPNEYIKFTEEIKSVIPPTANIFGFPQNIASYAVLTENKGNNAYIGTSPLRFFTGVNDLSGSMSYTDTISAEIRNSIVTRNYQHLLDVLEKLNIGYVMLTANIPDEVKKSFLFDRKFLNFQDEEMINAIVDSEVVRSSEGNYVLYKLKNSASIFSSPEKVSFSEISPVKFSVSIRNSDSVDSLIFYESYHPGWKLYQTESNNGRSLLFDISDIKYLFIKPLFESDHSPNTFYGNIWKINTTEFSPVLNGGVSSRYPDVGRNVQFVLYFLPQVYFYIGLILTILTLVLFFSFT